MANEPDHRRTATDGKAAAWTTTGVAAAIGLVVLSQSWIDDRVHSYVDAYSDKNVYPRVSRLEDTLAQQREFNARMLRLIEAQDDTRAHQFAEIIKRTETQSSTIDRIAKTLMVDK